MKPIRLIRRQCSEYINCCIFQDTNSGTAQIFFVVLFSCLSSFFLIPCLLSPLNFFILDLFKVARYCPSVEPPPQALVELVSVLSCSCVWNFNVLLRTSLGSAQEASPKNVRYHVVPFLLCCLFVPWYSSWRKLLVGVLFNYWLLAEICTSYCPPWVYFSLEVALATLLSRSLQDCLLLG